MEVQNIQVFLGPEGHWNIPGQRIRVINLNGMGDNPSAFEEDVFDADFSDRSSRSSSSSSSSSSSEYLIPDQSAAIALMLSCLANVYHILVSRIVGLYILLFSRHTVGVKMLTVLLLLLFGVWFRHSQMQMENRIKALTPTIEMIKLETEMLRENMQKMLVLMKNFDLAMYKLHIATEQLSFKIEWMKDFLDEV
ncbi:hypothetical protein QTP70_017115 [Hemibagrus guttatus]|uniref:Uncharacterized protein n=1 Tax=Hemibagrus guttatus TaxID=175788 RepID=A0AAE0QYR2_9TELE|nr:hypothetical protein QTP70_017115 [Hemibagrus guttatus]